SRYPGEGSYEAFNMSRCIGDGVLYVSQAFGQCEYDSCAVRLKYGWGVKLVAGVDEREIAGLGMFPSIEPTVLFSERSEFAASLYSEFRSQRIKGSLLTFGGFAAVVGAIIAGEDNKDIAGGLLLGGFVVWGVGIVMQTTAMDKLSLATWEYNRTLSRK
ncbi:MAG: hypothetical protein P8181_00590, partial [bacterium]